MYWDPRIRLVSHVLGSRASKGETVTTKQVQLGIGVRVHLLVGKVLGIPLLVTTCWIIVEFREW